MLNLTVKTDLDFLQEAVDIFFEVYKEATQTKSAIACLNFSPIAARTIRMSNARGGTAPGWAEEDQTSKFHKIALYPLPFCFLAGLRTLFFFSFLFFWLSLSLSFREG